jgi:hypothetical protein
VLDDECLHHRSPWRQRASRSQLVEGRQRVGRGPDDLRRPVRARVCGGAGALIGTREPA